MITPAPAKSVRSTGVADQTTVYRSAVTPPNIMRGATSGGLTTQMNLRSDPLTSLIANS